MGSTYNMISHKSAFLTTEHTKINGGEELAWQAIQKRVKRNEQAR